MAAAATADRPLTDAELLALSKSLTQEDAEALTDEEAQRLDRLVSAPSATDTATERKFTEAKPVGQATIQGVPEIPFGNVQNLIRAASMQNPLAGKPSLEQFEAAQAEAANAPPPDDTPQMGPPSYGTRYGADAPPLPQEETTFSNLGKKLGAAALSGLLPDSGPTPEPNPPWAGDAAMSDPAVAKAKILDEQNARIASNQPMQAFRGVGPSMTGPENDALVAMLPKLVPQIMEAQVATLSEFTFNPLRQLAQHPVEFGANVLTAAWGLSAIRKTGTSAALALSDAAFAAKTAKTEEEMQAVIKAATPQQVAGAHEVLETKLDEIDAMKDMNRVLGGDPEMSARLREMTDKLTEQQQAIVRARQGYVEPPPPPFFPGDTVKQINSGEILTVDSVESGPGQRTWVNVTNSNGKSQRYHPDWLKAAEMPETAPAIDVTPPAKVTPKTLDAAVVSSGNHVYHATNEERLYEIAESGDLRTHRPDFGTDQSAWPDGGTEKRAYFSKDAGIVWKFAPEEGRPVVVRVSAGSSVFRRERSTGDLFSRKSIPANLLEYLGSDGAWHPVTELSSQGSSASLYAKAAKAKVHLTDALSATPAGAILLKGAMQDDKEDPTPRTGSPLSIKSALWAGVGAGILGFGVYRYFTSPAFKEALRVFTRLDKSKPADLERLFETYIMPMIPDVPANGKMTFEAGKIVQHRDGRIFKVEGATKTEFGQTLVDVSEVSPGWKGPGTTGGKRQYDSSMLRPYSPQLWPDLPAESLQSLVPPAAVAGSAIAGAYVGSNSGQDEASGPMALLGLLAGGAIGGQVATAFSRIFVTDLTYRQLYRMFFTEAAGMSAAAVEAKIATRIALEGRVREIKDVSTKLAAHDTKTGAAIQDWMAGNANLDTVPEAARWDAAYARFLFDDLALDLLSSGIANDKILQETITTNLGTYLPRLLLRYELEARPSALVERYLRSQGKGWGYISNKVYLKVKKDLPPEVLRALGEITDNPGYLLAKRGPLTAADIEQARYHRFLMSSPENVLPTKTLSAARRVDRIQKGFIAHGGIVEFPPDVRIYHSNIKGVQAAEWQGRTYWQMPDDPRYGLLRGKFVEQSVASDIRSTHETVSGLQQILAPPLSLFKYFKAVMNPASQFRNMVTNAIFADIEAGVGPWHAKAWSDGFKDLNTGTARYREARRAGLFGGEFTVAEIQGMLDPKMGEIMQGATGIMDAIGKRIPGMAMDAAKTPSALFTKWHQGSEAWARMVVYNKAVDELGMDALSAVKFARRTIPDYQDVQRWVKIVRTSTFGSPFVSFCVPPDTEILTKRGWQTCGSVLIGDDALSLNVTTGKSEWKPITDVYRGLYDGEMLHFKDRHLDMMLTPDHRCVVERRTRIKGRRAENATEWAPLTILKASEVNTSDRIPVSAPCANVPTGPTYTDDQVRLIGWFVTEGFWRKLRGVGRYGSLCQSVPKNVVIIRDLLRRLGGHANERKSLAQSTNAKPNHPWLYVWHLREPLSAFLRAEAHDKSLSVDFVTALTTSQLRILIDTMMAGDGHLDKAFTQNAGKTAESFRIACALAGISNGYCDKPSRTSTTITLRKLNAYTLKRTKPERTEYSGIVWCPEVKDNGTFLARRNGKMFFTGNSYKAIPRSLEAAFAFGDPKKMMRFWKYPLAMAALNEYSAQTHGLLGKGEEKDIFGTLRRMTFRTLSAGLANSDPWHAKDSYDTFRKYLPGHVGAMQIGIPWRDHLDRQQYLDGTFFLPWGDAGEMGKGDFAKHLGPSWFPRQLEPSNPFFQLGVASVTGKDPFTGRDIIRAGAVGNEAYADFAEFAMRAWAPSLMPSAGYSALALERSFSGDYEGDPYTKTRKTAILSEVMGARTRPVDPATAYPFKVAELVKSLDKNKSELRAALKSPSSRDITDQDIAALRESHPSAALTRVLDRRDKILADFNAAYPSEQLPPSPQKLLDAIKKSQQR